MIKTLKITLIRGMYYQHEWSGNIELDESSTLEDLHHAIQHAVNFDNDHSYSFYLSRTERSGSREYFDDENGLIFSQTLKDLFPLPDKRCLFYLFDWGASWIFKISPSRKRPHDPVKGMKYPRLESEAGVKPEQYPGDEYDD